MAATLTPANGVASGSKGQVQGADTKVSHRLGNFRLHKGHQQRGLTPREASSWPDATTWLPAVASVASQQDFSPQASASSCL